MESSALLPSRGRQQRGATRFIAATLECVTRSATAGARGVAGEGQELLTVRGGRGANERPLEVLAGAGLFAVCADTGGNLHGVSPCAAVMSVPAIVHRLVPLNTQIGRDLPHPPQGPGVPLAGRSVTSGQRLPNLRIGEGLVAVPEEFSECGARCRGPDQGEHHGCLDVVDGHSYQPAGVVGGHGLAEDGNTEPAAGEICDGVRGAGLQRDVRL